MKLISSYSPSIKFLILSTFVLIGHACAQGRSADAKAEQTSEARSASDAGQAKEQHKSEARTAPQRPETIVIDENTRTAYDIPAQSAQGPAGLTVDLPGILDLNAGSAAPAYYPTYYPGYPHSAIEYPPAPQTIYYDPAFQQFVYVNPTQPEIIVQRPQKPQTTPQRPPLRPLPIGPGPQRPPTVIPIKGNCGFAGLKGKCTTFPNWFGCIRNGGVLSPDISRCQLLSACCVRIPLRVPAFFGNTATQTQELVDFE